MTSPIEPKANEMNTKYRTRSLGGSLLVIKGQNDCATIERGNDSKPRIVTIEGDWTRDELREARGLWRGSDAQRR